MQLEVYRQQGCLGQSGSFDLPGTVRHRGVQCLGRNGQIADGMSSGNGYKTVPI